MITRIDFVGMGAGVTLPARPATGWREQIATNYLAIKAEWRGYTVVLKGQAVVFERDDGVTVEVPRTHCVIYATPDPVAEKGKAA